MIMALDINNVLLRPIFTEKSDKLEESANQVTFEVAKAATKLEVKEAVKKLFNVRVLAVNTISVKGKRKRVRGTYGMESNWKKAIVKLHPEDRIEFPSVG